MKYVYKRTEYEPKELYTVGYYEYGYWYPVSDHDTREEAASVAASLNGDRKPQYVYNDEYLYNELNACKSRYAHLETDHIMLRIEKEAYEEKARVLLQELICESLTLLRLGHYPNHETISIIQKHTGIECDIDTYTIDALEKWLNT